MDLTLVRLAGSGDLPALVVGPSLGTSVTALWSRCAQLLGDRFHVVGWDLPGHGRSAPATEPFTMADLAAALLAAVDRTLGDGPFGYAGVSAGGAVGLQLALDAPDRLTGAAVLCTGARIGTPEGWHDRAALVRASGTPVMVEGSAKRWFAAGFLEREPQVATTLLASLQDADAESYSLVCEALAAYDVRDRLPSVGVPLLAVGGAEDEPAPADLLRADAGSVPGGRFLELDGVAHLAPAEAPRTVASLLIDALLPSREARLAAGMAVRRAVLGDDHVDRAVGGTTEVDRAYQDLITRYAWGEIWTRPGLARRDRSIAVLTALVAGRHFEELEFHLRAALRNGLTRDEIIEVLLQSAIYVGVPAANTAFGVAKRVLQP